MNARPQNALGRSAQVRMGLRLSGLVLPISHLGPSFLILNDPIDHPPADAEISMTIDGHEDCWTVHLPKGISPSVHRTALAKPLFNGSTAG